MCRVPLWLTRRHRHVFGGKRRIAIASVHRTMKRVPSRIETGSRDPFALSLAKLSLVRAFRFCYCNYLNRQTRQVCWPQAVVNYFLWVRWLWPKRGEIETNRFTICSNAKQICALHRSSYRSQHGLLFCCSTFLFACASRVTFLQILWLAAAASGKFLLFHAPFITWWLIQRPSLVSLQQQKQQ